MNKRRLKSVLKRTISMLLALVLVGGVYFNVSSVEVKAANLKKNTYAKPGVRYRGTMGENEERTYRFTLDRARKVKFTFNVNGEDADLFMRFLYNAAGEEIESKYIDENNAIGSKTINFSHYLPKGTYYFVISSGGWCDGGNYYWEYSTQALSRITQGVHTSYANAPLMNLSKDYFDHMGINTPKNVIKFNVTRPGYYQWYTTVSGIGKTAMGVYDKSGKEISSDEIEHDGNPSGVTAVSKRMRLTKGTYYIVYEKQRYSNETSGILKFRVKPYSYC